MRNRVSLAALCVALALACPARATVTSTASSASYTCNGTTTAFTIPFAYLSPSHIVATQTDASGAVTTVTGTVKPSIAPSSGTLTLTSACPAGSALNITRTVALTQPQSFRTGNYSGAAHEQAFDRLTMETQQVSAGLTLLASTNANATTTGLLTAADWGRFNTAATVTAGATATGLLTAADWTRFDASVAQLQTVAATFANATTSGLLTSADWVRFNGAVTSANNQFAAPGAGGVTRSIPDKLAEIVSVKDYGAVCDGVTDDTTKVTSARTAAAAQGAALYFPSTGDCVTTTAGYGTVPRGTLILPGGARTQLGTSTFAALGTPNNGTQVYCSDCAAAATCAAGGTGAFAQRVNGAWSCGASSGVALQSTFPGVTQTGNVNLNGTLAFNVSTQSQFSAGSYLQGTGNGLNFYPADFNTNLSGSRSGQYAFFGPQGNLALISFDWFRGASRGLVGISSSGCNISIPCLHTAQGNGENTPLYLGGSASGLGSTNKVVVTTSGLTVTSGNLFEVTNNSVLELATQFDGSLITRIPIPQTSGGTGAGSLNCAAGSVLTSNGTAYSCATTPVSEAAGGTGTGAITCTAGQFLTSNGTAYSCAAPSSASAYTTWTTATTSGASVPGSNCNVISYVAASGLTAGQGCVASSSNSFSTLPLSLTCEVVSSTGINFRLCNTGVNAQTPPANTAYSARVFP